MFDPDGAQAAADSTRSSTSFDTGSSLNPRTARRLVTASYTSMMIASPLPAIRFVQTHAVSFGPSAPLSKFVIHRSTTRHELRKQRGTSKFMILVPLFDLKFLDEFAAGGAGTSDRRH